MVTQHYCALLLNNDTFKYDISCTPFQIPCSLRCATWVVEGMVVTGKFRRAPDQSCSYFTIAIIHINSECAKRRSVCIALLLLIRELCLDFGMVSAEPPQWKAMPTSRGPPLALLHCGGPAANPMAKSGPAAASLSSQSHSHSGLPCAMVPSMLSRRPSHTWQRLHCKFAGSPADSKSRKKIVLHPKK